MKLASKHARDLHLEKFGVNIASVEGAADRRDERRFKFSAIEELEIDSCEERMALQVLEIILRAQSPPAILA